MKMRPILCRIPKIFLQIQKHNKLDVKKFHRTELGDKVTVLDETTLTGRLLAYIRPKNVSENQIESSVDARDIFKNSHKLRQYSLHQIFHTFNTLAYLGNRMEYLELLNMLDNECSQRVRKLKTQEIIELLHVYMKIIPNKIVQHKYYGVAIKELLNRIDTLTKNDLVQLIFYIGLMKKFAKSEVLRKCVDKFNKNTVNSLSAEELCIICNATFKTGTHLDNTIFLDKVMSYLNDNLYLLKDPALFITLLKTVRLNRYQNEDLLSTITCAMFFNKTLEYYSFIGLCHILALYSDFLYYDENVLNAFTRRCIQLLKENEFVSINNASPDQPRLKDIKRLLWSLSNLNFKCLKAADIKTVIIPNILDRFEAGELEGDSSSLIEIMLYLWMLNYHAYELVPYALTKTNIKTINESNSPAKHRLNLLLSCIHHEDKALSRNLKMYPDLTVSYDKTYQLEKRPLFQRIVKIVQRLSMGHEINRFEMGCQIPGLNILGITGFKKKIYKVVHIEVLDEYTTMKNTEGVPSGLMQLKMRFLDASDEGVIVISQDEMDSITDEELQEYILEEIQLVS
ncbi:unnamed protein product [Phaedon cochleariae]|uniref:Uncharacterized protein n=1 Tax=Phaedon cochleariae TaxID=80249 RepID=A0A9P0DUT0_PHACE|nr:unnamed protein product [Phaedon cochleariae]